jgi:uncharacterized protein (DUF305 family)
MDREKILIVILALLIGGIVGFAIGEFDDHGRGWGNRSDSYEQKNWHRDGDEKDQTSFGNMPNNMNHSMMMVSSEHDFIEGMIPHHEEAVATAKEVLERGATTPEIKTLAEGIIVAQEKEIADMKTWYQNWYGTEYKDTGEYVSMMRDLSGISGAELDKAFLEDMIMHHMGAIMMARSVSTYIEHEEMTTLTNNIVKTQSDEIVLMRDLLTKIQ